MIRHHPSHKRLSRKQRILEACLECCWFPARLLFALWIRLTPSYNVIQRTGEDASPSQRIPLETYSPLKSD